MISRSLCALVVGLAASVLGCQGPDITADLDRYQNLVSDTNILRCTCYQDLGFGSSIECDEALGPVTTAERACFDNALDGHESDAQDFLSCSNTALQEYQQCLAANPDCEPGVNDDCASVYTVAVAGCTQLPSDVQAAFAACKG
jgi:hypothetical protein